MYTKISQIKNPENVSTNLLIIRIASEANLESLSESFRRSVGGALLSSQIFYVFVFSILWYMLLFSMMYFSVTSLTGAFVPKYKTMIIFLTKSTFKI